MTRRLAACAAALGLAAACNATPKPLACPGEVVGVFNFTGTADVASDWCKFYAQVQQNGKPQQFTFTATLAWGSDTEAILCLDRPEADPLRGSRSGDTFSIDGAVEPAFSATACTCTPNVTQSLSSATVVRDAAGAATGITGGILVDDVTKPSADAVCEKATSPGTCVLPCHMRWTVTATR